MVSVPLISLCSRVNSTRSLLTSSPPLPLILWFSHAVWPWIPQACLFLGPVVLETLLLCKFHCQNVSSFPFLYHSAFRSNVISSGRPWPSSEVLHLSLHYSTLFSLHHHDQYEKPSYSWLCIPVGKDRQWQFEVRNWGFTPASPTPKTVPGRW